MRTGHAENWTEVLKYKESETEGRNNNTTKGSSKTKVYRRKQDVYIHKKRETEKRRKEHTHIRIKGLISR